MNDPRQIDLVIYRNAHSKTRCKKNSQTASALTLFGTPQALDNKLEGEIQPGGMAPLELGLKYKS